MTWLMMLAKNQELEKERQEKLDEIAASVATLKTSNLRPDQIQQGQQHIIHLKNQANALEGEARAVACEQNMRPAIAMGCLCFALVGCPIGIWFSKRDYLSAFITCFLPIVIVYYPLLLSGHSLARSGRVPPEIGVWVCDVVAGIIGLLLLRHLMKN
jgi:lipopolysaccharide export system permease protein